MKSIGILGGMSWESTALYYKLINEKIKERLGGLHSAKIAMVSVDFQIIEEFQRKNQWDKAAEVLSLSAKQIEAAGANFLVIATNTMHKVAMEIEEAISIPLLHIADATAEPIKQQGIKTIGLLGTKFTMEEGFYAGRLKEKHGLNVVVPDQRDREIIHRIIYEELILGKVLDSSRQEYLRIIEELVGCGAEGVIEGCTEIGMLVKQEHTQTPLFDTTILHVEKTVDFALT